jgi:hypothetical protein
MLHRDAEDIMAGRMIGALKLAHEAIHSAIRDVGASVVNLLIDVPGTRLDFEPPA